MSAAAGRIQTSYWRIAGLTFPRYANLTARVVRKCVKGDIARQSKLNERDTEVMGFRTWVNGKRGPLGTPS